ncbi:MAG: hypothetical protein G01um101477_593 [Candidatus Doudnabacteria bacterium Gr01-1014_77]|uniref:Uncharacterized protein n=1 Tax=Candidatus Doudnabacteria bacterium Gr01-1014_77 TaxID=2017133 RepID=A0A554J9W9_9BACT|nr:MAG: hypothetical protein G01um101477_593 [Candidatus Doudnabacteria bacterium Gr01-1014_77]
MTDQSQSTSDDGQHSAGGLLLARAEFREAHESLRRIEPDSPLLRHPGFEYTADHDIQGYDERALIMRERTRVVGRRKVLDARRAKGS